MAFKPTTIKPSGIVTVLFKGLLILATEKVDGRDNGCCEVGVHRMTDDHFPVIEIRGQKKIDGKPSGKSFLVMRYAGPLVGQDMTIALDPPTKSGVLAYYSPGKFDREKTTDLMDFRFNIDLNDSQYFHGYALKMFPSGVEPCIKLYDGTFFSETLFIDSTLKSVPPGGSAPKFLHKMAEVVGATIAIDSQHCLKIEWNGSGSPLVLPRTGDDAGTEYVISIRNEPLALGTQPDDNELVNYYQALRKKSDGTIIPPEQRFALTTKTKLDTTDEIPCMPVVLGP